mgnify:CR=1 FL=1
MIIKGWNKYSLTLTLHPSFTLSLMREDRGGYVKYLGLCRELRLREYIDGLIAEGPCEADYIREICGIVEDPLNVADEVELRYYDIYYYLATQWRGVGLSTASRDPDYIFISVYLSRRTSYHNNVIRWVNDLFKLVSGVNDIIKLETAKLFKQPQLRGLSNAIKEYLKRVKPMIIKGRIHDVRVNLLSIGGVGPKVTYAFMLHALRLTDIAPADTHYAYLANSIGIDFKLPRKELCIKYDCYECVHHKCLVGLSRTYFGRALGYLQTIAFMHVKNLCKRGLCDNCLLKKYGRCKRQ